MLRETGERSESLDTQHIVEDLYSPYENKENRSRGRWSGLPSDFRSDTGLPSPVKESRREARRTGPQKSEGQTNVLLNSRASFTPTYP